jgi:pyruvate/2-oxoglutarate/acetoin dehydrogenase E1 component
MIFCLGKDVTLVGYGSQLYTLEWAVRMAEEQMPGLSVELIDLRTLLPWDVETIEKVCQTLYRYLYMSLYSILFTLEYILVLHVQWSTH